MGDMAHHCRNHTCAGNDDFNLLHAMVLHWLAGSRPRRLDCPGSLFPASSGRMLGGYRADDIYEADFKKISYS